MPVMRRILVTATLCSVFVAQAPAAIAELPARLAGMDAKHPRLFFPETQTDAVRAKIEADPLLRGVFDYVLANCEIVRELPPMERKQEGRRLLGVSRAVLQRVSYLAFAYRMTGDEALLRRAEAEMLAAASFSDWNPSHFLDVAEMTAALAVGYDWLHDHLAPESRVIIRDAIIAKGLKPSLQGGWWVAASNNWNQVCHGGLTLGALAVAKDEPVLAEEIIARGLKNLPRALKEYEPSGIYPEGPTYWAYGTTYNILLIDALESALGSDFGITAAEALMHSPEFMLHATGANGLYFNFADCGLRMDVEPALHWFARRLGKPALLWHQHAVLERFVKTQPSESGAADRMLVFLLLWGEPMGEIDAPAQLHWQGDGPSPMGAHRSAWRQDATYAAIKGGSPQTNHGHMDIGSFVVDMQGVRWAVDLGAQSYNGLETAGVDLWNRRQDGGRWTVFRLNNTSHNTLVVNGAHQRVTGNAPITAFSGDSEQPYTAVDMTPVYDGQLAQAHRVLRLDGEAVVIHDEIAAPEDAEARVRWGMVTRAAVSVKGNTATMTQDGKTAWLGVLAPEDASLTVIDLETPPQPYDAKNPNTRMIAFEVTLPAGAAERLAVYLAPGEEPSEAQRAAWLLHEDAFP